MRLPRRKRHEIRVFRSIRLCRVSREIPVISLPPSLIVVGTNDLKSHGTGIRKIRFAVNNGVGGGNELFISRKKVCRAPIFVKNGHIQFLVEKPVGDFMRYSFPANVTFLPTCIKLWDFTDYIYFKKKKIIFLMLCFLTLSLSLL